MEYQFTITGDEQDLRDLREHLLKGIEGSGILKPDSATRIQRSIPLDTELFLNVWEPAPMLFKVSLTTHKKARSKTESYSRIVSLKDLLELAKDNKA